MSALTPQIATLLAAAGAAAWMAFAGVQKSALEWRRERRKCPSCGRFIDGRTCGHHAPL